MTRTQPGAIQTVRQKLMAGSLLTSIVALLLAGGSLFFYDMHTYREGSSRDLGIEAEMVGYATTAALEFQDQAVAVRNLQFLRARPNIRSAQILDATGKLFASYARDANTSAPAAAALDTEGVRIDGDRVEVMRRVLLDGEVLGTVHMQADLGMAGRIGSYAMIAFTAGLAALLVALALSSRLQGGITRPIAEFSDLARRIVSTRNYSLRATKRSEDEIGHLADAFNEMLTEIERRREALEATYDQIAQMNADLERRVKERTVQLEESNLRLQAADIAKSRFLSMMSHEIRTPMNGVLGMLELLALTPLDMQQKSTLEVVRESGRSLLRIIDDILDFSKIEAGKLEVIPQVASVGRIVAGVVGIYSGNASSKSLTLKSHVDPRISPAVLVDATRLQQVLNNLVSNAIKFTSEGMVELKAELVERQGDRDIVRFVVTDTGIGIAEEAQPRLFQPFAQADHDVTRVFGGTGLGLSIGQRLATLMGGVIDMQSTPGKGTTMTVTLPLPIADPESLPDVDRDPRQHADTPLQRPAAPTVEQAERDGRLVLVADDHPINRLVLMRQVTILGYANETANDGREAFALWKSGRFAAVITDCNMPEMNGYELARAIREHERIHGGRRTLIIACTANALRGEAENCFAAGMDDYISKPVEISRLMAKLDYWIPITLRAAEAQDHAAPPLDVAVLDEISGGDREMRRQALEQFQAVNAEDSKALWSALEVRDMAVVTRMAHRMRGASATLGAEALATICQQLEAAAKANQWEAVAAIQDAFHRELARANAFILSLLAEPSVTRA